MDRSAASSVDMGEGPDVLAAWLSSIFVARNVAVRRKPLVDPRKRDSRRRTLEEEVFHDPVTDVVVSDPN